MSKPTCERQESDPHESEEYQRFIESMAEHCRCRQDCPCAGVLAGGLCDGLTEDERHSVFDDDEFEANGSSFGDA